MKSKSLTFRIFLSTFSVGTLIYFLCALIFISNIYSYFERKIFSELETEAVFLEQYIADSNLSDLKKFNSIKNRITLIHKDGTVYFDNMVDASRLENHSLREEFVAAKEKGAAKVSRYSSTMTDKTLYFAKSLQNGDVLRISCDQHSVAVLVLGMSQTLLIMLVLAVIISGIAAVWTSRRITNPLNQINLEKPESCAVYEELKPFTKRIAEENYEKTQREELRKQFTANVSHELKTPLTSISGFAEILKNGGTDEKTTKDFAGTIYEESQRMISLVNDIIKLSKLDEKSISLEKEPIELLGLSKEIAKILSASAKAKNVKLDVHGDSGKIMGVQPVIYEMIYNLIDNAIKYNVQNGTVEVTVKEENPEKGHTFGNKTVISVRDTGIGIPKNEQDRVFERFYRIDKSRSKELGGTGLGLSIVKHAAKFHDAAINLSSKEGEGSTFTITFPGN